MTTPTRHHPRPFALLAIACALTTGAFAAHAAGGTQAWNWTGDLAAGRTLHINGVNGPIVVTRAAGARAEVTATKTGRKDDPAQVRILTTQDSDGVTICAVYPGSDSPCEHSSAPRGRSTTTCDVEVRFDVTVPAGVNLDANTVNGAVRAHGLTARLQAHTVNGACEVETAGSGEASTVNGTVVAAIGRADREDKLEFTSVNGSVTLSLPPGLDADVEGSTVNGVVDSEFSADTAGQPDHRHTRATLGRGGARVSASTVNGSVRLRRASAR